MSRRIQITKPTSDSSIEALDSAVTNHPEPVTLVDAGGRPYMGGAIGGVAVPKFFERSPAPTPPTTAADMNVSGGTLGTPLEFQIAPPSGQIWTLFGINLTIASTSFDMGDFGGISSGLTNGIELVGRQNTTIVRYFTVQGYPIKTNPGLIQFSTSGNAVTFFGASNGVMSLWISFERTRRSMPQLDGTAGENLAFLVKDDLSSLLRLRALCYLETRAV